MLKKFVLKMFDNSTKFVARILCNSSHILFAIYKHDGIACRFLCARKARRI